jgi:hypothetical protein
MIKIRVKNPPAPFGLKTLSFHFCHKWNLCYKQRQRWYFCLKLIDFHVSKMWLNSFFLKKKKCRSVAPLGPVKKKRKRKKEEVLALQPPQAKWGRGVVLSLQKLALGVANCTAKCCTFNSATCR